MTKKCTKCGEVKGLGEYYKNSLSKGGIRGDCKTCYKYRYAKWRKENPEKTKTYNSERRKKYMKDYNIRYYRKNIEVIKDSQKMRIKKYKKEKPELLKKNVKKYNRVSVDALCNSYLAQTLRQQNLPITPETIELKREIIKTKRLTRKIKNYVTEKANSTPE